MTLFLVSALLGLLLVESCIAYITTPDNPKPAPEIAYVTITNENRETVPGNLEPYGCIEIVVKNAPFTPYVDENGQTINTYYFAETRKPFSLRWSGLPYGLPDDGSTYVKQSDADYTIIHFNYSSRTTGEGIISVPWSGEDVVVWFCVRTAEGYYDPGSPSIHPAYEWTAVPPSINGEGSCRVYFSLTIPGVDKPGITTLAVKTTLGDPFAPDSNYGVPSMSDDVGPSGGSSTPEVSCPPVQIPWASYLVVVIVTVCIITIPIAIVIYRVKRMNI
jgi:hypothetical protein